MLAPSFARRAVASLLLGCVGLGGCYAYTPREDRSPPAGETAALFGGVAVGVGLASALLLSSAGGSAGPAPGQDGPDLTIRVPIP